MGGGPKQKLKEVPQRHEETESAWHQLLDPKLSGSDFDLAAHGDHKDLLPAPTAAPTAAHTPTPTPTPCPPDAHERAHI